MRPHLNSNSHRPSNGVQVHGTSFPSPQQILPQFQMGPLNGLRPSVTPFTNPTTPFPPMPFFPLAPVGMHNLNANFMPMLQAQNSVNMPQFLSNGQFNAQSVLQSANQILQMQMANLGAQSLGLFPNTQMGMINGTGFPQHAIGGNASVQISHTNLVPKDFGSPQPQHNQNLLSPSSAQQQNAVALKEMSDKCNKQMNSHKDLVGNYKQNDSKRGYGTKQFHDQKFGNRFKYNNGNREKGKKNIGVKNLNSSFAQIEEGRKRSLSVKYTDKEIQQWREERRKNYPSKDIVEKKLSETPGQLGAKDAAAEVRRQRLKEILEKQAELGCEVAEIPSHYLSGSEVQMNSSEQSNLNFGKRGRFGNKFDKRGKFNRNGRFRKKPRNEVVDAANSQNQNDGSCTQQKSSSIQSADKRPDLKREPSLLKKLLSSDIKKDNKHLLQALRFMVMNSFFENPSEKPLRFPTVIVKESDEKCESHVS